MRKRKIRVPYRREIYIFDTLTLTHKECVEKIKHKQKWEGMSMLAVLFGYKDIICEDCKRILNMRKEKNEKI